MDSERAMVQLKKSFEACFARRMEAYRPKKLNRIVDSERAMVQLKKSFEACFARRMEAVINAKGSYIKSNQQDTSATSIPFGSAYCVFYFSFYLVLNILKI